MLNYLGINILCACIGYGELCKNFYISNSNIVCYRIVNTSVLPGGNMCNVVQFCLFKHSPLVNISSSLIPYSV